MSLSWFGKLLGSISEKCLKKAFGSFVLRSTAMIKTVFNLNFGLFYVLLCRERGSLLKPLYGTCN